MKNSCVAVLCVIAGGIGYAIGYGKGAAAALRYASEMEDTYNPDERSGSRRYCRVIRS